MMNFQTIRNNKYATVALWVSVGVVTSILGNAIYKNIRKKGSITDGKETLNVEMKNLIAAIDKQPK
jgi:hypothetical protein